MAPAERKLGGGPVVGAILNDKWHVEARIGAGGMASVYAAQHKYGYRAAIKMLSPHLACDPDVRERFLREGYISNRVDHPATVRVLDDDAWKDTVFLVMELLEGETLEARRTRMGGRLPLDEVLAAADVLLDGLSAAHRSGVVHRDVKPENVFRTEAGELKVLDFGIAQLKDVGSRTADGLVMGTLDFMSPEQAAGSPDGIDARTDIWAAGATMFYLLSGVPLHSAKTLRERVLLASSTPCRSLAEVAPKVPREIVQVVDRALALNRAERWQDAASMQCALRDARARSSMMRTLALEGRPAGVERAREHTLVMPTTEPGSEPTVLAPIPEGEARGSRSTPATRERTRPSHVPVEVPRYPQEPVELPMRSARGPVAFAILAAIVLAIVGARAILERPRAADAGGIAAATDAPPPLAPSGPPPQNVEPAIPEPPELTFASTRTAAAPPPRPAHVERHRKPVNAAVDAGVAPAKDPPTTPAPLAPSPPADDLPSRSPDGSPEGA